MEKPIRCPHLLFPYTPPPRARARTGPNETRCTVEQEGVHVDSQFEVGVADGAGLPETDGNQRANFGEYIRYSMVVRNTGASGCLRRPNISLWVIFFKVFIKRHSDTTQGALAASSVFFIP